MIKKERKKKSISIRCQNISRYTFSKIIFVGLFLRECVWIFVIGVGLVCGCVWVWVFSLVGDMGVRVWMCFN